MNHVLDLLVQLATPLALGITVAAYLRHTTRESLVGLCGSSARAEFWVRVASVGLAGAPTVLVLFLGGPGSSVLSDTWTASVDALRRDLALAGVGILLTVLIMARLMFRQIPGAGPVAAQAAEAK